MLHFLEQDSLLTQQLLGLFEQNCFFPFDRTPFGDVRERQQDRHHGAGLVDDLAGVQQHDPAPDARKDMVDLEVIHGGAVGKDGLQQQPQRRDVPLAIAQVVEQAALGLAGNDLEGLVERTAGRQHAKLGVQHQEGLVDRIHDGLRQGLRVFDGLQGGRRRLHGVRS